MRDIQHVLLPEQSDVVLLVKIVFPTKVLHIVSYWHIFWVILVEVAADEASPAVVHEIYKLPNHFQLFSLHPYTLLVRLYCGMEIFNGSCSVVLESREPLLEVIDVVDFAVIPIHIDVSIYLGNWTGFERLSRDVVRYDGV